MTHSFLPFVCLFSRVLQPDGVTPPVCETPSPPRREQLQPFHVAFTSSLSESGCESLCNPFLQSRVFPGVCVCVCVQVGVFSRVWCTNERELQPFCDFVTGPLLTVAIRSLASPLLHADISGFNDCGGEQF